MGWKVIILVEKSIIWFATSIIQVGKSIIRVENSINMDWEVNNGLGGQ